MPKTRPAYPPEFRREAVRMLRAGRTPRELAKRLGVSSRRCVTGGAKTKLTVASGPTCRAALSSRSCGRCAKENARLKQERDLLKRAAAFFAAENERR